MSAFPNVIEWYRLTDPTKVDLMDLRFKPAKLEDLPPPTTPWDHCWDIHSREFWQIQAGLRARLKSQKPSLSIRPAGDPFSQTLVAAKSLDRAAAIRNAATRSAPTIGRGAAGTTPPPSASTTTSGASTSRVRGLKESMASLIPTKRNRTQLIYLWTAWKGLRVIPSFLEMAPSSA